MVLTIIRSVERAPTRRPLLDGRHLGEGGPLGDLQQVVGAPVALGHQRVHVLGRQPQERHQVAQRFPDRLLRRREERHRVAGDAGGHHLAAPVVDGAAGGGDLDGVGVDERRARRDDRRRQRSRGGVARTPPAPQQPSLRRAQDPQDEDPADALAEVFTDRVAAGIRAQRPGELNWTKAKSAVRSSRRFRCDVDRRPGRDALPTPRSWWAALARPSPALIAVLRRRNGHRRATGTEPRTNKTKNYWCLDSHSSNGDI